MITTYLKAFRQLLGEIVIRRPVFQLEQHWEAQIISDSGRQVLKAVPEKLQGHVWNGLVSLGVHNVML